PRNIEIAQKASQVNECTDKSIVSVEILSFIAGRYHNDAMHKMTLSFMLRPKKYINISEMSAESSWWPFVSPISSQSLA
ncbi:MAG: hypothetical protein P4M11_08570, partial [Candidatus Pacebacteria bacterium]|nr:hypothetical protein [Candidatus Paceibacterota bacterium]